MLAAAPTTASCIRHWRRSLLLQSISSPAGLLPGTWERVARDNQVPVNDLKAVNPKVQRLVSGSTLVIPARPGDKFEPEKSTAEELEPEGVPHIVKKGETLSVIARKYKMNWRTLQKFNKMNDRDVARLKIGQKIMIPKK